MRFWRTTEIQQLARLGAQVDAITLAAQLGRTPRAVQCAALARHLPVPRQPHGCYWPESTRRRARNLRRSGLSLSAISRATGVPFGTLRHWIYDMPPSVHPNDQIYALDRAIAACEATGEPSYVIDDLRQMRDAARTDSRRNSESEER